MEQSAVKNQEWQERQERPGAVRLPKHDWAIVL